MQPSTLGKSEQTRPTDHSNLSARSVALDKKVYNMFPIGDGNLILGWKEVLHHRGSQRHRAGYGSGGST